MRQTQKKKPDYSNLLAASITVAILAYLVGLSGVLGVWIPAWYRKGEYKMLTIIFIIFMTAMFFAFGVVYKRIRSVETRTERLEQGWSDNLWNWAGKRFKAQGNQIKVLRDKLDKRKKGK